MIAHAVWLSFRFPLSLRMVEDMLAARGIIVTHQTIRLWAEKFGRHFSNVAAFGPQVDIIIPPTKNAVPRDNSQRNRHVEQIAHYG